LDGTTRRYSRTDSNFGGKLTLSELRDDPGDWGNNDILMNHASVNFDRAGFQRDLNVVFNVVFPIDRLREFAPDGRSAALHPLSIPSVGIRSDRSES
jgi:hypothetical protein